MFFDLNHPWGTHEARERHRRLALAASLGYNCIAHNDVIDSKPGPERRCPIKLLEIDQFKGDGQMLVAMDRSRDLMQQRKGIKQLKRLTLVTDDLGEAQALQRGNLLLSQYDIIAIEPKSREVAEQACIQLDVDIITLNLAEKLPFNFPQGWLRKAADRGIYIEICYSYALRDGIARRNLFAGARHISNATRGKNLILSSGGLFAMEIRGPYDAINLASFCGLTEKQAKESITKNCAAVVRHAEERQAFKGAVIVKDLTPDSGQEWGAGTSVKDDKDDMEDVEEQCSAQGSNRNPDPPKKKQRKGPQLVKNSVSFGNKYKDGFRNGAGY